MSNVFRLVAVSGVLIAALAMNAAASAEDPPIELLDNFCHYTVTANPELAAGNAQALLESGLTDAELAVLLDEGRVTQERFERAITWAQRLPELEPIASELARRVEHGRQDLARDSKRIEEAITMLTGTQRQKLLGRQRLVAAGEYAVPALLLQITDGTDEQLKLTCQDVLVEIGRQAVTPLCEAMLHLTGTSQRIVCDVLGTIRHPQAAPYLREVSDDPRADGPVREAASRAFRNLGTADTGLSSLYAALARQYFDGNESLIAFPFEPTNNVWRYSHFSGLSPTPVSTEIFTEVMAMRLSSKAVEKDRNNSTAVSLFVAANLKRENDLPEGEADPIYDDLQFTPLFFATVFGTQTCLDVLAMAIDKLDTPLVRDAIHALSVTTGGGNLFARGSSRQPLLEAISYPDRRVQYEAALTLGRALPLEPFPGDYSVVPILASAVRLGNISMAMVVADDPENRRITVGELEQIGFNILSAGGSVSEVQPDVARAVGVDLVAVRMRTAEEARNVVSTLRSIPKTSATPILIVASATDLAALQRDYRDDRRVHFSRAGVAREALTAAIEYVMQRASGGRITDAEAEEYAIRALSALRDVAISRSPAYAIVDAEPALIEALDVRSGGTRMLVADILALIDTDLAQRDLFDAALAASGDEQVELLKRVADSIRIFGNRAEPRHVDAIVDLIASSEGATAEAAATVHGAMNLPRSAAVNFIPTK